MVEILYTVNGVEKITARMEELSPALRATLQAAAEYIKGKIATYPPETDANAPKGPGGGSWYERGYGTRRIPGRGKNAGKLMGRKTSETLGKRWTITILPGGLTAIIGNNASYGPFVQDRTKQAKFHTLTGWITIQDAAEQEGPTVIEMANRALAEELKKLGPSK